MQSKLICLDFETDNSKDLGLQIWHPDFKIDSCAFLTPDGDKLFSQDFNEISNAVRYFYENDYTFLIFNAGFDCTILKYIFKLKDAFKRSIDCWRIASICNLSVDDKHKKGKKERNTSLAGCVSYYFGEPDFKKKYQQILIDSGKAKNHKQAHANISMLPSETLEEYNMEDVIQTLRVYECCINLLEVEWGMEWKEDHRHYMHEAELYSDAFMRGFKVDRELLLNTITSHKEKIEAILASLRNSSEAEEVRIRKFVPLCEVTKKMRRDATKSVSLGFGEELTDEKILEAYNQKKFNEVEFNPNSTEDLKIYFIDVLKYPVLKWTAGGKKGEPKPAFSKDVLKKLGEKGGEILKLKKLQKELNELEKVEVMSSVDGYLHCSIRSSATISGRTTSKTD